MSIARILSELAINTNSDDIPQSSYVAANKMFLDTLACVFAGIHAPGIAEITTLEQELSAAGNGTVFSSEKKLALPSAAFCNAAIIHAMDFDCNYPGADLHLLAIVTPIALACSEASNLSGHDCQSSIILGVEVAGRIAKQYMQAKRSHDYFLTTSLVGGWGGVAVAARLLGLSVEQTVNAMGIYYAHTCGNRQALLEKKLSKRMQPAIAAKAAFYSVLLAQKGFTGPEYTFEGKGGFYRCYTLDQPPAEKIFHTSTATFCIEELVTKPYPSCGFNHASIFSALHLKHKYAFQYADIERVEFFLVEGGNTLMSMPFTLGEIPQISAQFCAPYGIALALNKGEVNICDFSNEKILQDINTMDLASRTVEITHFADMNLKAYSKAEKWHRYIKVYLKNNEILEHGLAGGAPLEAMGMSHVEEKFRQCMSANGETDPEPSKQIIAMVDHFQELKDVSKFVEYISQLGHNKHKKP
jgi:2-methylcitrate dehydratase PrpD